MIDKFKKTKAGLLLYRLLRKTRFGDGILFAVQVIRDGSLSPRHCMPSHLRHNSKQKKTLKAFEAATESK